MSATVPLKGAPLVAVTFALSLGIFMNVLDVTIANVAIPVIAGNLGVSPDQGTWVITSFSVSQAIMLPITGWLARRFGEVRLFAISTFLFALASIFCGLSTNLTMLIFFRVIQGAVSGPMIPLSQSLLLASYPDEQKGFATGLWAMTAIVAPICGPILGGVITDNYTWPWIFYINLPIGLFSAGIVWFLLKDRETPRFKMPIDVIGLMLLAVGVGALQILLDKGNDLDWFHSNFIIMLTIIAVISLSFLIAWELGEEHPIIDLSLFAKRNFLIGTTALTLGFTIYFGIVVIFPLWLQTQMGYTPTWAGLASAPVGFLPFFLTPFVGHYMGRFDLRWVVTFGFIMFGISSYWSTNYYTDIGYIDLIKPRLAQGIGLSFFFAPLISIILSGLPQARVATALGLSNFCRIIGGSFGTSLSVTFWDRREAFHHSRLVEAINTYNPITTAALEKIQNIGLVGLKKYQLLMLIVTNQAYMLSTNDLFLFASVLFLGLIIIIWFAKPPFTPSQQIMEG